MPKGKGSVTSPHADIITATEELFRKAERGTEGVLRLYKTWADYYELQTQIYKQVQNLVSAYALLSDSVTSAVRTLEEGVSVGGRLAETFMNLSKTIVSATDALAAVGNTLSAFSTAFQELSRGIGTIQNVFDTLTKFLSLPLDMMGKIVSSLETIQSSVNYLFHNLTSFVSSLQGVFSGIFELGRSVSNVVGPITQLAGSIAIVLKGFEAVTTTLNVLLQLDLQRIIIPIQRIMVVMAQFSATFQTIFIPLRVLVPVLQTMISTLGNLIGLYGRLVLASQELLNTFAQLQGMALSLTVYLERTGGKIGELSSKLRQYGITLSAVFDYVKSAISAGLVPLTSFVEQLTSISRQMSVLLGLTPDEVFRRLTQAVIEGNAALLQQIGVLMTEADILSLVAARFGLLVTSLRQIHPFIRQMIMMEIVGREATGVRTTGGVPLMVVVGELRAIIQNFATLIGNIMRTYTIRSDEITQLNQALRRLFGSEIANTFAQAISNILRTIAISLTPIIENLRSFFNSVAFQNLIDIIRGIIIGLGAGVNEVIERLKTWLEKVDPKKTIDVTYEVARRVALLLYILTTGVEKLFPLVFSYVGNLFSFLFKHWGDIFKIISESFNILRNVLSSLLNFVSTLGPKAIGTLSIGLLGAAAGFTLSGGNPLGALIGGAIGAIVGYIGGGWVGGWLNRRLFGDLDKSFKSLDETLKKLTESASKSGLSLDEFQKELKKTVLELKKDVQAERERIEKELRKILQRETEDTLSQIRSSYERLIQAVQPVYEHFRNVTDALRDFFPLFTMFTDTLYMSVEFGEFFLNLRNIYFEGSVLIRAALNELLASFKVYTTAVEAASANARGLQTDIYNALRQVAAAFRRFYETLIFLSEQISRVVNSLVSYHITISRLQFAFGTAQIGDVVRNILSFSQQWGYVVGRRIGELLYVIEVFTRMLGTPHRRVETPLIPRPAGEEGEVTSPEEGREGRPQPPSEGRAFQVTIAALETIEKLWSQIYQIVASYARALETAGAILLAHSEFLKEQISLFTVIYTITEKFADVQEQIGKITQALDDYFRSLGLRIGAAFMTGNVEEFLRLSRQLLSDLRTFFTDRLPQQAAEIADFLMFSINMWMKGLGELRNLLQQLGAEGLVFPLMLRHAIPELMRMTNYLIMLRDEAFRQGLIPAAMEFHNRLLQVQRTILEILGLGGMFLPAYTPEQVIRARELMGTLPIDVLVGLTRGRLLMEIPGLRVVPPAAIWQLLAFAPGLRGLFGPFISPGQMFQLLPVAGLFRGLWEGFSFLQRVSPQQIRELWDYFFQRWSIMAQEGTMTIHDTIKKGIEEGWRTARSLITDVDVFRDLMSRISEIKVETITANTLRVNTITALPSRGQTEGTTQPGRETTSSSPSSPKRTTSSSSKRTSTSRRKTTPKPKRGTTTRRTSGRRVSLLMDGRGIALAMRGTEGGLPIMVGELGLPEIVHIPSIGRRVVSHPTLFIVPPAERINVTPTYNTYGLRNLVLRNGEVEVWTAAAGFTPLIGPSPHPPIVLIPPSTKPPREEVKKTPSTPQTRPSPSRTTPQRPKTSRGTTPPSLPPVILPPELPPEEIRGYGVGQESIEKIGEEMAKRAREGLGEEESPRLGTLSPADIIFGPFARPGGMVPQGVEPYPRFMFPLEGIWKGQYPPPPTMRGELLPKTPTPEESLPLPKIPRIPIPPLGIPFEEGTEEEVIEGVRERRGLPEFPLRPQMPTIYPIPIPFGRQLFPYRPFPTPMLVPLRPAFGFGILGRILGGLPPFVLQYPWYPYERMIPLVRGEGGIVERQVTTAPPTLTFYVPTFLREGPFLPMEGIAGRGVVTMNISFRTEKVEVPVTFQVTIDVRDEQTGRVMETITKEISTIVVLNPRVRRY
ncbi:MAG: hypothetical protein QW815_00460 [Nitrososphaerota archaeon]